MDALRWQRARSLFDTLAGTPQDTWEARLAALCPDDAEVRAEALALLHADLQATLTAPLNERAPELIVAAQDAYERAQAADLAGRRLGPYVLVRELGRGGMGQVWYAQRADGEFAQAVAIKLIRSGWDADDVLERFRAERQILASLVHPNIAHLVDGGVTDDGKPWLALEYVDGTDLRAYCDTRTLDLRKRLGLFLAVCDAVAYAHARLVVHRDLKPSNLLVDATGQVKLLDFGIAKLIDANASASTARVFTPEYAAPEQVRGELVTTAVDVYALGLLLYENLTGRRPYKVENSTPAAYERAILDQEPTRPSVAATREAGDVAASDLAARRRLSPERLRRELRGDLDAIVLKALRKEPEQRYASVQEMAADVRAHLDNRPVAARRGGWRYRAARLLRRHAPAAIAAALAAASLVAGLVAALHQRNLARIEARKTERVLEFMVDNYRLADRAESNGKEPTARELLDRGATRIAQALGDVPEARTQMLETMGHAYIGLGVFDRALAMLEPAVEERRRRDEPAGLANALLLRSAALKSMTRNAQARASVDEARALLPRIPRGEARSGLEAEVAYATGMHEFVEKRFEPARAELQHALDLRRALYGADDDRTHSAALFLSRALASLKDLDGAIALIEGVVNDLRRRNPPDYEQLEEALDALGHAESKRGNHARAEAAHRECVDVSEHAHGAEHWYVAIQLNNLGKSMLDQGRAGEAVAPLERAVRIARATLPAAHGFTQVALRNLGDAEAQAGRCADALRDLDAARDLVAARGKPYPDEEKKIAAARARCAQDGAAR